MTTTLMSNKELVDLFEQDMKYSLEGLAESTIKFRLRYVNQFLNTINKPAFDVSKNEINHYIQTLKKQDGTDMNVDAKQNHLSAIKKFYEFLFEGSDNRKVIEMREYADSNGVFRPIPNPCENIKAVNSTPAAKLLKNPRKEGLTFEDTHVLLEHLKENVKYTTMFLDEDRQFIAKRDYAMILLMLETGLRYSDVATIKLSNNEVVSTGVLKIAVQKTKKVLTFHLSEHLMDAIDDFFKLHDNRSDILFCTLTGNQIDNKSLNVLLKKYAKHAGIEKEVTCHVLRHTCGALMYNETKDAVFVKELLGHSSITTTQRYVYSEDVVKKMGETTARVTERLVNA